ncbi:hypothetical protein HDU97_000888 [Phlyctochytrium planicorne]|nr:hypothetical protein HDU97_000888 [Phlyctochytrium planicorne]
MLTSDSEALSNEPIDNPLPSPIDTKTLSTTAQLPTDTPTHQHQNGTMDGDNRSENPLGPQQNLILGLAFAMAFLIALIVTLVVLRKRWLKNNAAWQSKRTKRPGFNKHKNPGSSLAGREGSLARWSFSKLEDDTEQERQQMKQNRFKFGGGAGSFSFLNKSKRLEIVDERDEEEWMGGAKGGRRTDRYGPRSSATVKSSRIATTSEEQTAQEPPSPTSTIMMPPPPSKPPPEFLLSTATTKNSGISSTQRPSPEWKKQEPAPINYYLNSGFVKTNSPAPVGHRTGGGGGGGGSDSSSPRSIPVLAPLSPTTAANGTTASSKSPSVNYTNGGMQVPASSHPNRTSSIATPLSIESSPLFPSSKAGGGSPGARMLESRKFSCQVEYQPRLDDEIPLRLGDIVKILDVFNDGWARGNLFSTCFFVCVFL